MSRYAPQSSGLLQPIQKWMQDPEVSEILINKPCEIFVEKKGVMTQHAVPAYTPNTLDMLFNLIARENYRAIDLKNVMMSGSLSNGERVQLVIPPVSKYPVLSIRKKVVRDSVLENYKSTPFYNEAVCFDVRKRNVDITLHEEKMLRTHYVNNAWHDFMCLAVQLKKNIVISGATSTGKTTFLNACLNHIPNAERLITLEDTREIKTAHSNQVNLLTYDVGKQSKKVTMQDLMQCSLRLRPDRIIVGELRGKEVIDFISACCTGHSGNITTIHASNPSIVFMRMCQMYKLNNVPSMRDHDIMNELEQVVDVIVQLQRTSGGKRSVQSVYYKGSTTRSQATELVSSNYRNLNY